MSTVAYFSRGPRHFGFGEIWWVTPRGWCAESPSGQIVALEGFGDSPTNHAGLVCKTAVIDWLETVIMAPGTSKTDRATSPTVFFPDDLVVVTKGRLTKDDGCYLLHYQMPVKCLYIPDEPGRFGTLAPREKERLRTVLVEVASRRTQRQSV